MPGRRSGCSVLVNRGMSKPWPLPPSERWPVLLGPSACQSPPFSPSPALAVSRPLPLRGSRLRAVPPRGDRRGDICGPLTRKRTKETQPSRALRFPPKLLGFPERPRRRRRLPALFRISFGNSTANGWSRARWTRVFARGGRRRRRVKISLPSACQRKVCDWRPIPHPGRRRGPPDRPAAAPGHARGSRKRSNSFWAWGTTR